MPATKKVAAKEESRVQVPEIRLTRNVYILEGLSPLITRKMPPSIPDRKAPASGPKEYKDEDEFEASIYWGEGKNRKKAGLLPVAFKHAGVSACRSLSKSQMTMVLASQTHHVTGSWAEIKGSKPKLRKDVVRVPPGSSKAVNRVRAEFWPWTVEIEILFNEAVISPEQLVALYNLAGFAVGVYEWRPERGGMFGMYKVKSVRSPRG